MQERLQANKVTRAHDILRIQSIQNKIYKNTRDAMHTASL